MVTVTKLPPGKAIGAGDLHRWGMRRLQGKGGMPETKQERKGLKQWKQQEKDYRSKRRGRQPLPVDDGPDPELIKKANWAMKEDPECIEAFRAWRLAKADIDISSKEELPTARILEYETKKEWYKVCKKVFDRVMHKRALNLT